MRVTFKTRAPIDDEVLAHPNIAMPIAVASHWLERQVLHGAAVMLDGRAWGILGGKEAGKSTTAGWFHRHGHCVLSDDLLIIDGTVLFAGPRCIDLRAEAADALGGQAVDLIGRPKWRLRPGTVPGSVPLGGFIHLEWGDEVLIESLGPVERLRRIVENFVLGPDLADAVAYLELAALPAYRFVRPRKIASIDVANGQLLDRLG
jgi:hypothetical protein